MSRPDLTDLAHDLAADGFAGREHTIRAIVRVARQHGVSPTLVDLLADPDEHEIVRQRAFGRIAVVLEQMPAGRGVRPAA